MKWFRLHNKLLNDPAVQKLSGDHFKMYINMLCLASSEDKGGYIGTIDDVSFALRCVSSDVSSCFIALQESDLLVTQSVSSETDSETLHETFHINKWAKNQYESDSSTKRVKKFREKVKRSKGVTDTVTETAPDTDTEQREIQTQSRADTEKNKQKDLSATPPVDKKSKRFVKPTVEQVQVYCLTRKNGINAQDFINHYDANGWKRGNTSIKDWKACVRTWEGNRQSNQAQPIKQDRLATPDRSEMKARHAQKHAINPSMKAIEGKLI